MNVSKPSFVRYGCLKDVFCTYECLKDVFCTLWMSQRCILYFMNVSKMYFVLHECLKAVFCALWMSQRRLLYVMNAWKMSFVRYDCLKAVFCTLRRHKNTLRLLFFNMLSVTQVNSYTLKPNPRGSFWLQIELWIRMKNCWHCELFVFWKEICEIFEFNHLTANDGLSRLGNLTFLWTWVLRWIPRSFTTHVSLCNTLSSNKLSKNSENPGS